MVDLRLAGKTTPRHRVFVTPGDPSGIGPEVMIKAIDRLPKSARRRLVIIGDPPASYRRSKVFSSVPLLQPRNYPKKLHRGGYVSGWSVVEALRLIHEGLGSALVTGPISKEHLRAGGFPFDGHTELLGWLTGHRPTMMLANDQLRVSLVTTHIPLQRVSRALTPEKILRTIAQTHAGLRAIWKIQRPRIALLALNPHAGESGLLGKEEAKILTPAIVKARRRLGSKGSIEGPFAADSFFANEMLKRPSDRFDAVVALYHDQGLIPVKLIDFKNTVNLSLGLPFLRTSVDHGTAFDIAGKNRADPSSMEAALRLALNTPAL